MPVSHWRVSPWTLAGKTIWRPSVCAIVDRYHANQLVHERWMRALHRARDVANS